MPELLRNERLSVMRLCGENWKVGVGVGTLSFSLNSFLSWICRSRRAAATRHHLSRGIAKNKDFC